MKCKTCNDNIELERLQILPNTLCCAACAHKYNFIKPRKGIMVFDGKTGGVLQTMSAEFYENNKHYFTPIKAQMHNHSIKKENE